MDQAKPHVLMIAYHFPPAPEVGGLRPFRFRKYLQRMGYRVDVITAAPSQESAGVIVVPDPLRALWEGESKQKLSFQAYVELLYRKLMFPGHIGFLWARDAAVACHKVIREHPADRFVVFSTYPPMGTLLAGLRIRRREKIPWIADFRDPISGVAVELMSRNTRFWSRVLEWRSFRLASAVIANSEAAAKLWQRRYPWAQQKLHAIGNGFDPEDAPGPREIPPRGYKLLVHAGALYHGRNPNAVLESLARLRRRGNTDALATRVLLLGWIDQHAGLNKAVFADAQREGWLELRATVPRSEAQHILQEADELLLVQPQSSVQVPGKLFEYICIGRPILALAPKASAIEQILQGSAAAQVCLYVDDPAETIDRKLAEFLRLPSTPTPANDWFRATFNAESQTATLAEIIGKIAE